MWTTAKPEVPADAWSLANVRGTAVTLVTSAWLLALSSPCAVGQAPADTVKVKLTKGDSVLIQSSASAANAKLDELTRTVNDLRASLVTATQAKDTASAIKQRREARLKLYPIVIRTASDFLYTVVIGTASTFTGAGIANQEIRLQQVTSPWRSDKLRNGVDKVKPWTDALGAVSLGLATVAGTSDGPSAQSKILGISGGALIAGLAILKQLAGSNEDKVWSHVRTGLDSLQTQVDQIYLSRQAYNEIEIRRALANRYYKNAGSLLDSLKLIRDSLVGVTRVADSPALQADAAKQDALAAGLVELTDRLFATVAAYEGVVSFVDEYANNLIITYGRYKAAFPLLAPQFATAEAEVVAFQTAFIKNIKGPWLDALPRYRVALADLRTEMKK